MKRNEGEYFADPKVVAEAVIRMFALHDNVKDPSNLTLEQTFEEVGLNPLDVVEILLQLESHFDVELADDQCESFRTIFDISDALARNFYTKT